MLREYKDLWIKALRSDRYKQIHTLLKFRNSFYALGVLCDVTIEKHLIDAEWENNSFLYNDIRYSCIIPSDLMNKIDLSFEMANVVSDMNDNGYSFSQIADYIEKNL